MCRLLYIRKNEEFEVNKYLQKFAQISKNSKEYQGHGWGCAYLSNDSWMQYKNINPIWEDDLSQFPRTKILIAHSRSAFQDKGIVLENNMPFYSDDLIFIFNGELRGVKIKEKGRIGAEKIFNYIQRQDGSTEEKILTAIKKIKLGTKFIRSFNLIIVKGEKVFAYNEFHDDPSYFSMYIKNSNNERKSDDKTSMNFNDLEICSDPLDDQYQKMIKETLIVK